MMKIPYTPKKVIHVKFHRCILCSLNVNKSMNLRAISNALKQGGYKSIAMNNLCNHLNRLITLDLVDKIKENMYCLSTNGSKLIYAYSLEKQAEDIYKNLGFNPKVKSSVRK